MTSRRQGAGVSPGVLCAPSAPVSTEADQAGMSWRHRQERRARWPARFSGYRNWAALCPTWDKRTARPALWLPRRTRRACSPADFHKM